MIVLVHKSFMRSQSSLQDCQKRLSTRATAKNDDGKISIKKSVKVAAGGKLSPINPKTAHAKPETRLFAPRKHKISPSKPTNMTNATNATNMNSFHMSAHSSQSVFKTSSLNRQVPS